MRRHMQAAAAATAAAAEAAAQGPLASPYWNCRPAPPLPRGAAGAGAAQWRNDGCDDGCDGCRRRGDDQDFGRALITAGGNKPKRHADKRRPATVFSCYDHWHDHSDGGRCGHHGPRKGASWVSRWPRSPLRQFRSALSFVYVRCVCPRPCPPGPLAACRPAGRPAASCCGGAPAIAAHEGEGCRAPLLLHASGPRSILEPHLVQLRLRAPLPDDPV